MGLWILQAICDKAMEKTRWIKKEHKMIANVDRMSCKRQRKKYGKDNQLFKFSFALAALPHSTWEYVLVRFAMLVRVSGCSAPSSFFLMSNAQDVCWKKWPVVISNGNREHGMVGHWLWVEFSKNPRPPSCLGMGIDIGGGSGDSVYASMANTEVDVWSTPTTGTILSGEILKRHEREREREREIALMKCRRKEFKSYSPLY